VILLYVGWVINTISRISIPTEWVAGPLACRSMTRRPAFDCLLVPWCLDGLEHGCTPSRVESEDYADRHPKGESYELYFVPALLLIITSSATIPMQPTPPAMMTSSRPMGG